jgi:hypothetical protein
VTARSAHGAPHGILAATHRIRNQGVPHSRDASEVATWNPSGVSSTARAVPTGPSGPRGFPSRAMSTTPAFPTRTCARRENSISKLLPPASILPASSLPSAHAQNQLGADARTELECARRPVEACEGAFTCVDAGAVATGTEVDVRICRVRGFGRSFGHHGGGSLAVPLRLEPELNPQVIVVHQRLNPVGCAHPRRQC